MRKTLVSMGTALLWLGITAGLGMAQAELPVIQEQSQGDVRFMSGGVGVEEREFMDSKARDYNVKLVFALASREYLSDVRVTILDAGGKSYLAATANGPWMLAKLPDADCIIQVALGDQKLVETRKIGKGLQVVNVLFKP
jgi:hypothetical protein